MKKILLAILIFVAFSGVSNAKNVKERDAKGYNIDIRANFHNASIIENKIRDLTTQTDCVMYAINVIEDCYLCDDFLSDVGYFYLYQTIVEDCYRESSQ